MADTYTVVRTREISAPASVIYDLINDFHAWQKWSPWEGLDPTLQRTYSGPDAGVGAHYEWSGNRKAGRGHMEITGSTAPVNGAGAVELDLVFEKPFKSSNRTAFTLAPGATSGATSVEWRMVGPRPLLMKLFGFAFNLDKLVGKDFEKGLAQLETVSATTS